MDPLIFNNRGISGDVEWNILLVKEMFIKLSNSISFDLAQVHTGLN